MAKEYAKGFYASQAWKNCRDGYYISKRGLCERCLKKGLFVGGEIVHHKTHITPDNLNDPTVALNWDNLELLCRSCHALEHGGKRYKVDVNGHIVAR